MHQRFFSHLSFSSFLNIFVGFIWFKWTIYFEFSILIIIDISFSSFVNISRWIFINRMDVWLDRTFIGEKTSLWIKLIKVDIYRKNYVCLQTCCRLYRSKLLCFELQEWLMSGMEQNVCLNIQCCNVAQGLQTYIRNAEMEVQKGQMLPITNTCISECLYIWYNCIDLLKEIVWTAVHIGYKKDTHMCAHQLVHSHTLVE